MQLWYFNIQLLPIGGGEKYVGEEGYKALFEEVNRVTESYWKSQKSHLIAFESRGNYHAFKPIVIGDKGASGHLKKFDLISEVVQTYTDQTLFSSGDISASSESKEFYFYFSYENHVLALQKKAKVPTPGVVRKALFHLLKDAADKVHPDYTLHVSILNSYSLIKDLEEKSSGYYGADIHASFSNSFEAFKDGVKELDQEFRDKGVDRIDHRERAAKKGGLMTRLSNFAMSLLVISIPSGYATVTYQDSQTGRREKFNTDERPVQLDVDIKSEDRKTQAEKEEIDRRIDASIAKAIAAATESKSNKSENERFGDQAFADTNGDGDEQA
ncbi:DUF4747 family protein [Halomonas sp. HG01]|uniref:DUF4747 family protein n=1 Tax=Halomonas sp. HG01 TaxID=1609967 RepID=UPI0009E246FB|nr:DUF4747 family protein [Halomonas sp. HG01]